MALRKPIPDRIKMIPAVSFRDGISSSWRAAATMAITGVARVPMVAIPAGTPGGLCREDGVLAACDPRLACVGGICAAGFVIEDLCEPDHTRSGAEPGSFADRAAFLPPYLRILARRGDWVAPPAAKLLVG